MARYMVGPDAFVAVIEMKIKKRDEYGAVVDAIGHDLIGPYDKASVAKAQVTIQRRERGKAFVDGYVVKATGWERID